MKVLFAAASLLALDSAYGFTGFNSQSRKTALNIMVEGRNVEGATEVKAAGNFLLVKVANAIEESQGGILLAGKSKIQKTEGTVVSVGPGKTHPETGEPFEIPIQLGEGVVYGRYDGTEIEIEGTKHSLIRDDDILVKFSGPDLTLESCDVIRDSVLVYVEQKETETEGGLLLTKSSSSESKPSTGKVVKVGPGVFDNMAVSEGDYIKFRDFMGNEVELDGEEYSVVRMADILARF
ncbi:unnamed protein product [Cylindrotheca closterium]|uniref:20 kDa chaperonin, chloroplastic n=1 Tax=Cylindrotheca closterium TaxID=2856 RepID=A0AAD2CLK2_9STRA|nr:unnamed protein product [Cylindrotheca closterium]